MSESNAVPAKLTDYQLMWLTWALLDKGGRPSEIVDALSPPYNREQIRAWLNEAGPTALAEAEGKRAEIERSAFAALVYEAQQQQRVDPAEEEDRIV